MIVHPGNAASTGYNLTRSLRFRASATAYLSRTPASAGNRRTYTWSGWVKRGKLGSAQGLFEAVLGPQIITSLYFNSSDQLVLQMYQDPSYNSLWTSNAVFCDPSAWYHIVFAIDTTQATNAAMLRLYVNGVLQTTPYVIAQYSAIPQNYDTIIDYTTAHSIGRYAGANYFDGYLAETNFIDGQALTPSSFGSTNSTTGVWQPAAYTGTYGTNGFYLPFTDNSALTTSSNVGLGKDFSGNGNYWTTNNISITAGVTYDSMTDVPTLTSATAANFAVLNPLNPTRSTLTNGNLTASGTTDLPTIIPASGTWYFEISGVSKTWTPPAAFPAAAGDYNFGQRPFANTPTNQTLNTFNLTAGTVTTSGSFTGNVSADGPSINLNGVPTAMTINGNAVTFGTHADKTAYGFKVISSSTSYNSTGTNTYSITTTGAKFKYANAQGNP